MILNVANGKADQSPSEFQTGTGEAAHATFDTQQHSSSILTPELHLLKPFPLHQILREE